jgi:hypothetical protein
VRYFLAAALLAIVGLVASGSATAAAQVPFTISEQINFATGDFTFTTTGPLCASGTFADTVQAVGAGPKSPGVNLLITTVYTCDDGSGTFDMVKHVFLTFNPDGSQTNTGPVQLLGGTGAYANLLGHGVDNGSNNGVDTGSGQITGWVLQS